MTRKIVKRHGSSNKERKQHYSEKKDSEKSGRV